MKLNLFLLILCIAFIFVFRNTLAQLELPQKSPLAEVFQKIGNTDIKIVYHSPAVNSRIIWGGLVPFGKIWRTGANEATTIEFGTKVKIENIEIDAGKYSLFTIPGKDEWTVILNADHKQWGAYSYDGGRDVIRFQVKPLTSAFNERLKFSFPDVETTSGSLCLQWEKIAIKFKIESHLTDPEDKNIRVSPLVSLKQRVGLTDVQISYGSPAVRNRIIWGELVPFRKVWRTGANEATTIEFNHDIKLNNQPLRAGRYSFFTIPEEKTWAIIINHVADQWGAFQYDRSKDVLRFTATPKRSSEFNERLVFTIDDTEISKSKIRLSWENLTIVIPIETEVHNYALENINVAIANNPGDWITFASAAQYAADYNIFTKQSIEWINKSIELKEHYWNYYIKAQLYKNLGDKKAAKKLAGKSRILGESDSENFAGFEETLKKLENSL
ncbi:MAG: DUF2911 domain-containing protein [Bacteroidetes bacterium]|nr:DUF2911 domain-containing protein [Bacteroidota bacterium]MBU1678795.1 DUF2911 domain-containing protein [Bacteroidota bacterium]MBU2507372.1 DUF2911 domain-containing protein [Bacteroidota bacterium]